MADCYGDELKDLDGGHNVRYIRYWDGHIPYSINYVFKTDNANGLTITVLISSEGFHWGHPFRDKRMAKGEGHIPATWIANPKAHLREIKETLDHLTEVTKNNSKLEPEPAVAELQTLERFQDLKAWLSNRTGLADRDDGYGREYKGYLETYLEWVKQFLK